MYKNILLSFLFVFISYSAFSQSDLDKLADEALSENTEYALGTFFSSRIVSQQSVFMMPKRGLDFRVQHRFGEFSSGFNNFYGIDESTSYLSLEYGVTDWFNAGISRATYKDMFNGFAKFRLLRQSSGGVNMPVSVIYVTTMGMQSTQYENDKQKNDDFQARLSYTHQLLIARMITPSFSVQLSPTMVHRNLVPEGDYQNNTYVIGLGARYKLTNTFSINGEWSHIINPDKLSVGEIYDPISIGVDIQVASHVFQIHLTNAEFMSESNCLTETKRNFFKGQIRPGFNISQVFTL